MLSEIRNARQIPGEPRRRWFTDDTSDLIVWLDDRGGIAGFQLCYDKFGNERALTWRREGGYRHDRVDDGEPPGDIKMTPILVPDGEFAHRQVAERFRAAAAKIDPELREFVVGKLLGYSG